MSTYLESTRPIAFPADGCAGAVADRRKRLRARLHWPVRLSGASHPRVIETTTENLSSTGFYCFSEDGFARGERLDCVIAIPTQAPGDIRMLFLRCRVEVMRVDETATPRGFGIACRIETYSIASRTPDISAPVAD